MEALTGRCRGSHVSKSSIRWAGPVHRQYLNVIARTLSLAALTIVICMGISLPVAHYIARQLRSMKAALVHLVPLPFRIAMIVRVYA